MNIYFNVNNNIYKIEKDEITNNYKLKIIYELFIDNKYTFKDLFVNGIIKNNNNMMLLSSHEEYYDQSIALDFRNFYNNGFKFLAKNDNNLDQINLNVYFLNKTKESLVYQFKENLKDNNFYISFIEVIDFFKKEQITKIFNNNPYNHIIFNFSIVSVSNPDSKKNILNMCINLYYDHIYTTKHDIDRKEIVKQYKYLLQETIKQEFKFKFSI